MRFIADGLTALRVLSAGMVLLSGLLDNWGLALLMFAIGVLSDAFDGPAARRWPYTEEENRRYWWRKDAHQLDNNADLLLSGAGMVVLSLYYLSWGQAIMVVAGLGLLSYVIQAVVDRNGPRNPRLAERIDVAHGWLFGLELATMLVLMTLIVQAYWLLPIYAVIAVPLLWFKWDRVVSRSELTYGA